MGSFLLYPSNVYTNYFTLSVIRIEFLLVMIIMDMVGHQILEETVSADI